jgi:hypothetical protein
LALYPLIPSLRLSSNVTTLWTEVLLKLGRPEKEPVADIADPSGWCGSWELTTWMGCSRLFGGDASAWRCGGGCDGSGCDGSGCDGCGCDGCGCGGCGCDGCGGRGGERDGVLDGEALSDVCVGVCSDVCVGDDTVESDTDELVGVGITGKCVVSRGASVRPF